MRREHIPRTSLHPRLSRFASLGVAHRQVGAASALLTRRNPAIAVVVVVGVVVGICIVVGIVVVFMLVMALPIGVDMPRDSDSLRV